MTHSRRRRAIKKASSDYSPTGGRERLSAGRLSGQSAAHCFVAAFLVPPEGVQETVGPIGGYSIGVRQCSRHWLRAARLSCEGVYVVKHPVPLLIPRAGQVVSTFQKRV